MRLEPHDGQVAGAEESAFCGKLLCGLTGSGGAGGQADGSPSNPSPNPDPSPSPSPSPSPNPNPAQADGSQFVFCDDPANFYGWPRELGAVVVRGMQDSEI